MKLYRIKNTVVNKDGETRHYTNFFMWFESGNYIQVKPSFATDFKTMLFLAKEITKMDEIGK